MEIQSFGNVISLSSAQQQTRRQAVKSESVAVINDCRDIAVQRITAVLAKTFDKIEKELFDLAESAFGHEKQAFYLDAREQARQNRSAIEQSFRQQFLCVFETKVSGEDQLARSAPSDFDALSLVENNDLEEKLAMNAIAANLSRKCDDELNALSQRMGLLLAVPAIKEQANPLSPDTIVKALRIACDQMASGYEAKLAVMKLAEQHMAKEMLAVYRDINAHLIQHKVMPQIRPAFQRMQTSIKRKEAAPGVPQAENGKVANGCETPAADIFATLRQLLAGGKLFDADLSAGSAAPPAYGVTTGSFAPVPPNDNARTAAAALGMENIVGQSGESVSTPGLVSALSRLQLQPQEDSGDVMVHFAARAGADKSAPHVPTNAAREIKTSGLAHGSSPIDTMTIDIVAMLFDYVFEDKGIPDAIKALLARLQIPVLKVAILDKSFFSRKNHPARRLLDLLADSSVSFADGSTHHDPLYKKTLEIVDYIQAEFDTDIQIFSQMLAGLEQFLLVRETANANTVEHSAKALHEREKRELARLIAQNETGRRASDTDLPLAVSAMLAGPWTRILERIYLREGGRGSDFNAALGTADNLVWSVAPKTDAHDRKRLVALLPALLRQLQEGLQIASVEAGDSDRFFSALVDCHAAAVRAGLRGESVSTLLSSVKGRPEVAPLFVKLIAEEATQAETIKKDAAARAGLARINITGSGVEIEELASTKIDNARVGEANAHTNTREIDFDIADASGGSVKKLERGTWVEFVRDSGGKIRAKLSWISPLKGVYLFTNPGSVGALSVTPDVLRRKLATGEARILAESSLVDRAVDNMVHSLSGAMRG